MSEVVPVISVVSHDENVASEAEIAVGPLCRVVQKFSTYGELEIFMDSGNSADLQLVVLFIDGLTESGMCFLVKLRKRFSQGIIAVSRRIDPMTRLDALESGADDFVVLPWLENDLLVRASSLLKKSSKLQPVAEQQTDIRVVHDLVCDFQACVVRGPLGSIRLAPKEFELLRYFIEHPHTTHSRDRLLQEVWGSSSQWQSVNTVTEHVRKVRQALGQGGVTNPVIRSVRGFGYRLTVEPSSQ